MAEEAAAAPLHDYSSHVHARQSLYSPGAFCEVRRTLNGSARRRPGGCVAPHRRRNPEAAQIRPLGAPGQPFSRSRSPNAQRCAASHAQVSGQAAEGFGGAWCVLLRGRSRRASGGGRILFAPPQWLRGDAASAPRCPAPR